MAKEVQDTMNNEMRPMGLLGFVLLCCLTLTRGAQITRSPSRPEAASGGTSAGKDKTFVGPGLGAVGLIEIRRFFVSVMRIDSSGIGVRTRLCALRQRV
jgi:hypothetical protein